MADDIAQPSEKNTTGEIDPSRWDEAQAVTGRPQDQPAANTTFADRAKVSNKQGDKPDAASVSEPAQAPTKASRKRKS